MLAPPVHGWNAAPLRIGQCQRAETDKRPPDAQSVPRVSGVQMNGVGRRASDGTAKRGGCGYRDHVTYPRTRGDTRASATSATTLEETPLSKGWQECSGDGQDRPGDSKPPEDVRSAQAHTLSAGRLSAQHGHPPCVDGTAPDAPSRATHRTRYPCTTLPGTNATRHVLTVQLRPAAGQHTCSGALSEQVRLLFVPRPNKASPARDCNPGRALDIPETGALLCLPRS